MSRTETIQDIQSWTPYRLANEADCGCPDKRDSIGAQFLTRVRDDVLEAIENVPTEDLANINDDGTLDQIADSAPSIYTYERWQQFVDLAAWQEDITDYGPIEDMEKAAGTALYMIAERLTAAIVAAIQTADADEEVMQEQ